MSDAPVSSAADAPAVDTRAGRRRARTEARLVDAAAEVFGRKGVAATTIADITETADVGLGTFYNYFDSKEAIEAAVTTKLADLLVGHLRRATNPYEDPAERLAVIVHELFGWYGAQVVWGPFLLRIGVGDEALVRDFGGLLLQLVGDGVESGRFSATHAELASISIAGMVVAALGFLAGEWIEPTAATGFASQALRLVGLPAIEADAIAKRLAVTS